MMPSDRYRFACIVLPMLAFLSLASIAGACVSGSVPLSLPEIFGALGQALKTTQSGTHSSLAGELVGLRLDRAMSAFATGASLSLAGVMLQALLRNPLADPYVLGVSGGASVGALAAMFFFSAAWVVDLAAFGGALTVALMLFLMAHRDLRAGMMEGQVPVLLLTGVIIASGCGALVALILSLVPDEGLRGMVFWLIGDLSGAQTHWLPWLVLSGSLLFSVPAARPVNLLVQHAETAATLGIRVGALRKSLFVCAALLTASAVSSAGSIGFVGLIIPHVCRFLLGPDHRLLLPAATMVGGSFLVVADTVARTIVAPQQLPVGVVTALIGVPVFLLQLHRIRSR